jgi:hydrogenase-4 component B
MSGYSAALVTGLALLAAAAAVDLAAGTRLRRLVPVPYLLGALGSASLAVAGGGALAGHRARLWPAGVLGPGTAETSADRLSGLFLVIAFGAAAWVSLAFASWARQGGSGRRGLGASYALALAAVAVFLTGQDAFTVLLSWELLTVAFYLLAGFERGKPGRASAALVTLSFGKVSGALLLAGLLLLAARSGSLTLASFGHVPAGGARTTAQVLLLLGFAVKVGLVPFQVWLPRGYAAAPGPARAVMAGVAVNVGFYGMWRTLALLGPPPAWVTGLLLVLAGLTAVLGIAHAAVQTGLMRVIAYSSVENTGLILAGFGVALVGATVHDQPLVAVGLLAATLQVIAHTVAKSLLFTASAGIETPGGTDDLDELRGVAKRTPWRGAGLAIGGLTLAGLPPTAGFVSEWFLLEALMQQFRVPGLGFRLVLAVAGAAVALTAGFAGVTFVRLIGLVVLGQPRSDRLANGTVAPAAAPASRASASATFASVRPAPGRDRGDDAGLGGRLAIVVLGAACLVVAALTPLEIRAIAAGLTPVVPSAVTSGALKSPWVLQPVFAGFSIVSPSWLWIVMPALFVIVGLLVVSLSGRRMFRVRRVPPWRSATAGVTGSSRYTAFGFANPTRRVLAGVLHTRTEIRRFTPGDAAGSALTGAPAVRPDGTPGSARDGAPDGRGLGVGSGLEAAGVPHVGYESDVIEVVEEYLYRPVLRPVLALARAARRLQSGRLDAYLAYMLIALIAMLAVVTALN